MVNLAQRVVHRMLEQADIAVGGDRPWDIQVNNRRFWRRAMRGSLGFGESYMDGDWDAESLDAVFRRLIRSGIARSRLLQLNRGMLAVLSRLSNRQTRSRSRDIAETHYDLDRRLYAQFLGPYMQYSCNFFHRARTLEEAETEKLEMVCNKLDLRDRENVVDIGCGWGGFARYASETRHCRVTGVNISSEQVACAREQTAGLPVTLLESDYRDLPRHCEPEYFDKAVSIGMFEHVGHKNYRTFFRVVHRHLRNDGLFLLHTIGNNRSATNTDPWLEKYIFRHSMLPSAEQIARSLQGLFVIQDWENYGHYYARTLSEWRDRFEAHWPAIRSIGSSRPFDERFRRMFRYYLSSCMAAFETEFIHLWQIVLTKEGQGKTVYPRVNLLVN